MHRMITMHARLRHTERQTDGQTDVWQAELTFIRISDIANSTKS